MRPLFEDRRRSEAPDSHARADAGHGLSREGRTNGDGAWPNQHLDHVAAGAFEATLAGEITGANSALAKLLGFASSQDLVGSSLTERIADPAMLDRVLGHGREGEDPRGVEVTLRTKRGDEVVVLVCTKLMGSTGGPGRRVVGTVIDITERKHRDSNLERLTFEDPLTGVPTRRDLDEHGPKHLAFTVRRGTLLWD